MYPLAQLTFYHGRLAIPLFIIKHREFNSSRTSEHTNKIILYARTQEKYITSNNRTTSVFSFFSFFVLYIHIHIILYSIRCIYAYTRPQKPVTVRRTGVHLVYCYRPVRPWACTYRVPRRNFF